MIGRSPQPALRPSKIEHAYRVTKPAPLVVEFHEPNCSCPTCEPYVPSSPDMLTWRHMGQLAVAGAAVGSALAFAYDPAGAAAALLATIGF